ncbi:cytochrome P450 6B7 [Amyelois transitella]|uniref:cytochrome P450 6B7 n=1 Tax=Amyelois transitella TaxID=680683 RepID=UPI00067B33C5|nr:cytochrome P450 6B7 [Amyelois transitella]
MNGAGAAAVTPLRRPPRTHLTDTNYWLLLLHVLRAIMITVIVAVIALIAAYLFGTRYHDYWLKKGIKHDKPIPFFGTNFSVTFGLKSVTQVFAEAYRKYPTEKAVGLYFESRPMLVVRDLEIAKRVLTTDFANYYSRGLNHNKDVIEPMAKNLFFVDGDTWRLLRQRMTPAFTSGKLKAMFPLIVERAEKLQTRALQAAAAGKPLDARDLMARYTTDFIGACGFGLDADSLNEEDSAFRKLGVKIFKPDFKDIIVIVVKQLFPELFKHAKVLGKIELEINALVHEILTRRNYEPSGRNDFIDLLLECRKKGLMVGESIEKRKPDGTPLTVSMELDEALIAAQVFVFFAAGFETSSSATSYTLHELAYNPQVQKKVQDEVDRVLAKHNNKLSYDAIREMTYLECTFKEGMRIFPSLGFLLRECMVKTEIPELGITLDPRIRVAIPLQAIQTDPQYFDNPWEFRPERFMEENSSANKFDYLPFGIGPRACIGERLGLMQSLAGLAAVLAKFTVKPAPASQRRPPVDPRGGIVQIVKDGIPLIFEERTARVH